MIGSGKLYRAGIIAAALIAAPVQASNAPTAPKLSVAQAAGSAEVMKLPVCKGNDTTPCRKKAAGSGGVNATWVVMGAAVIGGAIVAATAGSP